MPSLTNFQSKCESTLVKRLSDINTEIHKRELAGEKETYIHGFIGEYEIWIYLDGAEIQGKEVDLSFERIDYDSEKELINVFVENIVRLLSLSH